MFSNRRLFWNDMNKKSNEKSRDMKANSGEHD